MDTHLKERNLSFLNDKSNKVVVFEESPPPLRPSHLHRGHLHMTLTRRWSVPKKIRPPPWDFSSVEGSRRWCFRSKYKGFPNFLLFWLRFQCFFQFVVTLSDQNSLVQTKLSTGGKFQVFFLDYFQTTLPASVISEDNAIDTPRPYFSSGAKRRKIFLRISLIKKHL